MIPVGARVRHDADQYPAAYRDGTATVIGYAKARDGSTEYLVERDRPLFPGGPTRSQWAPYRTNEVTP